MFPAEELTHLRVRKQLLVARSGVLRIQCVAAAAEVTRPIGAAEAWAGTIKSLLPYLRLAVGLFWVQKVDRRRGLWGLAVKWAPALLQIFQWFKRSKTGPLARPKLEAPS